MALLRTYLLFLAGFLLAAESAWAQPQTNNNVVEGGASSKYYFGPTDLRIMPLGDSLTEGVGAQNGYRARLKELLEGRGIYADFVGSTQSNSSNSFQVDPDHEGHGGFRVADLIAHGDGASATTIEGWLLDALPDVILLHIGTNDVSDPLEWHRAAPDLEELLSRIYETLPEVTVLLARTLQTGLPGVNLQLEALNRAASAIARQLQFAGFDLRMVDMESIEAPFSPDASDPVHPAGPVYEQMAELWATAIANVDRGAPLVPPAPIPLGFTGASASTFDSPYPPAAAASGLGLSQDDAWFAGTLHRAEGTPFADLTLEPANGWRSEKFPVLWETPTRAIPGVPVWFEARFASPQDVDALEIWAGRGVEFVSPDFGTDFRIFDAVKEVYIWTLNSEFEWVDRGRFDLRRPPRTRRHPGEYFDVDWTDVQRIRIEVLELDLATASPDVASGEARAAFSEIRAFKDSDQVGAQATSLISVSDGGRVPITLDDQTLAGAPYRVLGSGLWELLQPVFLNGFPLELVGDQWFAATLVGMELPLLTHQMGVLNSSGSATAWFELPGDSPADWAGAVLRHRLAGFDPSGTYLTRLGPVSDILFVP